MVLDYFWFSESHTNTVVMMGFHKDTPPHIASKSQCDKGVTGTFCGFSQIRDLLQKSGLTTKLVSNLSGMTSFNASGMFDDNFMVTYFVKVANQHNCLGTKKTTKFNIHKATWKSLEKGSQLACAMR